MIRAGTVPVQLVKLHNLWDLSLADNNFSGEIWAKLAAPMNELDPHSDVSTSFLDRRYAFACTLTTAISSHHAGDSQAQYLL